VDVFLFAILELIMLLINVFAVVAVAVVTVAVVTVAVVTVAVAGLVAYVIVKLINVDTQFVWLKNIWHFLPKVLICQPMKGVENFKPLAFPFRSRNLQQKLSCY
jgi:hypothetical protein